MSEKSPKGSLPNGWIVKPSKHYPGKVYYFNILTGDSTWECPELNPPRVLSEEEAAEAQIEEKSEEDIMGRKNKRKSTDASSPPTENSTSQRKTDAAIKSVVPPTAVVVPVVHKNPVPVVHKNSAPIVHRNPAPVHRNPAPVVQKNQVPAAATPSEKKVVKLKRCLEETSSSMSKVIKLSGNATSEKKRKSVSPLNNSDLPLSLSPTNQKRDPIIPVKDTPEDDVSLASPSSASEESINDVEMRDISIDLDDLTEKKETVFDPSACYYIVVDTNVFIGQLNLVSELKDTPLDGCGPPHIFIPWVVIEELDKLKSQKSSKVSPAIRYLNSVLGKHPRFHGQSPAEAEKWAKTYSKNNDDKILECCMGLSDRMPAEKVILLTNDKNLVNKALIHKINVHNFESLMKKVKPDTRFNYDQTKDEKKKKEKEIELTRIQSVSQEEVEDRHLQSKRDKCKREIHSIMSNVRELLKDVLLEFFEGQMEAAYGSIWRSFPVDTRLLRGILEGMLKYWRTVFYEVLSMNEKKEVELLFEKVKRPEGFLGDKDECLVIISAVENIFDKINKSKPELKVPVKQMNVYRTQCFTAFKEYSEAESKFRLAEEKCIRALLDDNWTVINEICVIILNHYNVPHDFKATIDRVYQGYEIERIVVSFYPGVEQMRNLFRRILEALKSGKSFKLTVKKLAKVLLEFIPSLKLHYECSSYPFFSIKAFERWFSCPQNRERIEVGTQQIQNFFSKLEEALLVILQPCLASSPQHEMICD